jgi:6-phosphogluconate dehydrogenase
MNSIPSITGPRGEIGMVGLGVMGRNLLLNMAGHGFPAVGYDQDPAKVEALRRESSTSDVQGASDVATFIGALRRPRAIMMLVPAGAPVDAVLNDLLGHLEPGDLVIDGGNSHFKDTDARAQRLMARGIHFLGVGVSGGEEGARRGPSIMPGGPKEAYERVRPIFEAAAAKVGSDPCVTHLGPGSAGHFVKMVHNGIEYGIMQLIAETYDLMRRGLRMKDEEIGAVYASWNEGELNGYLMEITRHIFERRDETSSGLLLNVIRDVARQKNTGMWTSQCGMELQVPIPSIDVAVAMRDLSQYSDERQRAGAIHESSGKNFEGDRESCLTRMGHGLHAAMLITYAQGLALLKVASDKYGYQLDLEAVTRIWRGGCIIRTALLESIREAFHQKSDLPNLLLAPTLARLVADHESSLRDVVCQAAQLGVPAPGLMVSLGYLDAYRSRRLPTNLIQAQRDYFGAHTYERTDAEGTFHTRWESD